MKPIIIFLIVGLLLVSASSAAVWDVCLKYSTITISNNNPVYPMTEHDINISISTVGSLWEAYRGGIYVTDVDTGGTRFARQWWNQTAFGSTNTIIWFKTNVSAGAADNDIKIYYNCGGFTPLYRKNDTITLFDDFDDNAINYNLWNNASTGGLSCWLSETNSYLNIHPYSYCGLVANATANSFYIPKNSSLLLKWAVTGTGEAEADILIDAQPKALWGASSDEMLAILLDTKNAQIGFRTRDDTGAYVTTFDNASLMKQNQWMNFTFFINQSEATLYNSTHLDNGDPNAPKLIFREPLNLKWWSINDSYLKLMNWASDAKYDYIEVIKYFEGTNAFSYTIVESGYGINENNQTYNATVSETSTVQFEINFKYNATYFSRVYANLTYDGSIYSGVNLNNQTVGGTDGTENDIIFKSSVTVPEVLTNTVKYFYWNVTLVNQIGSFQFERSNTYGQTVQNTNIFLCGGATAGKPLLFNFTAFDESDNTPHNASFKGTFLYWSGSGALKNNYSYVSPNVTEKQFLFCYDQIISNIYTDAMIEYSADGYDVRNYFMVKTPTSADTQNISLYLLGISYGSGITFHVTDTSDLPYNEAIIKVQRYDAGTNTYRLVSMGKTDSLGESYLYLRKYDAWYRFLIELNGTLIYTSEQTQIKSDDIYIKIAETTISELMNLFGSIQYSLSYSKALGRHTLTYSDSTGTVVNGCLKVIKRSQLVETQLCNTCVASSSSTILCNSGNSTGTYIATFYIQGSPDTYIAQIINDIAQALSEKLGRNGLIFAVMFVGLLMLAGLFNPVIAIVMGLAGLILVSTIGIVSIPTVVIGGFIVVVLILIFKLKT